MCIPVYCHTGQSLCCSKLKCYTYVHRYDMWLHIYLLVIAVVCLYVGAIFNFCWFGQWPTQLMQLGCCIIIVSTAIIIGVPVVCVQLSSLHGNASKFICGTYIGILIPLVNMEYLGIGVALEGNICFWHIYGNCMVNWSSILLFLLIYVDYSSSAVRLVCEIWQASLFSGVVI